MSQFDSNNPNSPVILAPDVFVNASVALGSAPEHVVRRVLTATPKSKTSTWILDRVADMLSKLESFKAEAVEPQMNTIRGLVEVVDDGEFGADAWLEALIATARKAKVSTVVTDHPDLLELNDQEGVLFVSTESWLLETTTPPPPPAP